MFGIMVSMNIEKRSKKKEANVPADKQEEFKQLASEGRHQEHEASRKAVHAESTRGRAEDWNTGKKMGLGVAAAGAWTSNIPMAVTGGAIAAGTYAMEKKLKKDAEALDAKAAVAAQNSQENYSESRNIVSEGMKEGGAEVIDRELAATQEQKDVAHAEMGDVMEERKRIEEELKKEFGK